MFLVLLVVGFLVAGAEASADTADENQSKTVIGRKNAYLYDGSQALLARDGERGVALTLKGIELASSDRERKIGHANLCAGYLLLDKAEAALTHCNWVLERDPYHWRSYNNRAIAYLRLKRYEESEADVMRGQELNARSENLKEVKGMLLDEVEPVVEQITIDDRREQAQPDAERPEQ